MFLATNFTRLLYKRINGQILYVLLQAQAVELLCRCDDIPDDGIELRVLKGLLTAVTSNYVHVHGQALLLVSTHSQSHVCQ